MTPRDAALIDAAMTVRLWQAEFPPEHQYFAVRYIARQLGCYPSWSAIEAEIVRREMGERDDAARLAA
jgi:hypothetical protein